MATQFTGTKNNLYKNKKNPGSSLLHPYKDRKTDKKINMILALFKIGIFPTHLNR